MRKPRLLLAQPVQLDDDRLGQRRQRDRRARRRRHVADAELERAEGRVRPQVPPDLLAVVDAVQLDQHVDVVPRTRSTSRTGRGCRCAESGGTPSCGTTSGRCRAPARTASWSTAPAGAAGSSAPRSSARSSLDRIGHRDVDVQAEDQQRARQLLQLLDDVLVALAGRDDLVHPVRERMRAGGGDAQADALGARRRDRGGCG